MLLNRLNLINNVERVRLMNPNAMLCAMVKANAYGLGLKQVVKTIENRVDFFGVATEFEAKQVRHFSNKKILIVGALDFENGQLSEDFSHACSSLEEVKKLKSLNKNLNIHIKINSGMNRYGVSDLKEFKSMLLLIKKSKLNLEGVFTHFATADDYVEKQMSRFNKFLAVVKKSKLKPIIHADNSAVSENKNHALDMLRVGFDLYNQKNKYFSPVAEIKTKIVQLNEVKKGDLVGYDYRFVAGKNMRIAVVPLGYADGIDMGYIGIKLNLAGSACEIVNICMDCFMLDVTNTSLKLGDEIYILNDLNPLTLYANHINSTPYEVMTKFSHARLVRKFLN